jgi:cation diffusion facilitator family transporter
MDNTEDQKVKSRAAGLSIITAIILTLIKLIVGLATNSLAILSLSIDSFLDTAGSVTSYVSVKISGRPPDPDHQYGHGKIENLGSLLVAIIIFIAVGFLIFESINRLFYGADAVIPGIIGYTGLGIAIIIDIGISLYLSKIAVKYKSQVLEANSIQFKMDIWTQALVIIGLLFVTLGYNEADALMALAVSAYIFYLGFTVGKKAIDSLLDRAPKDIVENIDKIVKDFEDIVKYGNLRVRTAGPNTFVDMNIFVPRIYSLEKAHKIASALEEEIKEKYPNTDVVVHIEAEQNKENIGDKIRMIADSIIGIKGVHDLWIRKIDNNYVIDAHIEVSPEIALSEAHNAVTNLENLLISEFGKKSRITLHIDTEIDRVIYTKASDKNSKVMEKNILKKILDISEVKSCDMITSKKVSDKFHVSVSCKLTEDLKVEDAHRIAEKIEDQIIGKFKKVSKVFVHTEPP